MTNTRWTLVLALLTVSGCLHGGGEHTLTLAEDRLVKIAMAYTNATNHLRHAPKGLAEIRPYFEGGAADEIIRSPDDGEEFVILWGVDYNKLPPRREDPFTVAAYEKRGTGGKRYVLRIPTQVVLMTDKELADAVFPPGYQPPQ
jgi:hypothetical protein